MTGQSEVTTAGEQGKSERETNLAAARQYIEEVLGKNNRNAAGTLIAPDFVYHSSLAPQAPVQGRDAFMQIMAGLHTSFPDIRLTIEDAFAGEDRVVVRFTALATYRSAMMGVEATGKEITMIETHVVRLRNGHVVEDYASDNNTDFQVLFAPVLRQAAG